VLNRRPKKRTQQIQDIDLFADIPYLNGGLFRPSIEYDPDPDENETVDRETFKETDFDVRNSVLISILELLESYSFSTDGSLAAVIPAAAFSNSKV